MIALYFPPLLCHCCCCCPQAYWVSTSARSSGVGGGEDLDLDLKVRGGDADFDHFFFGNCCFLSKCLGVTKPGAAATNLDVLDPCLDDG